MVRTLSRPQLASDIDEFRAALHRPREWVWVASAITGLVVASTAANYCIRHGTTGGVQLGLFLGGIAVFVFAYRIKRHHARRIRAAFHIACPACGTELLDTVQHSRGQMLAAEYTMLTGTCGNCGASIVTGQRWSETE
jgi:predicted RNA-binding Zn-ribbon protein involved in translation (DUF1610 family)